MTFKNQLLTQKVGTVLTKSKVVGIDSDVTFEEVCHAKRKLLANITGTVHSANLAGKYKTTSDCTTLQGLVIVSAHAVRVIK